MKTQWRLGQVLFCYSWHSPSLCSAYVEKLKADRLNDCFVLLKGVSSYQPCEALGEINGEDVICWLIDSLFGPPHSSKSWSFSSTCAVQSAFVLQKQSSKANWAFLCPHHNTALLCASKPNLCGLSTTRKKPSLSTIILNKILIN